MLVHFSSFIVFFLLVVCSANKLDYVDSDISQYTDFYASSSNTDILDSKIVNRRPVAKLSDALTSLASVFLFKNRGLETFDNIILRGVSGGANIIVDGVNISDIEDANILISTNILDLYKVNVTRGILLGRYGGGALSGEVDFATAMTNELSLQASIGYGNPVFEDGAQNDVFRGYFSLSDAYLDKSIRFKTSYSFNISDGYNHTNALVSAKDNNVIGYIPSVSSSNVSEYIVGNIGKQKYNNHNFKFKTVFDIGDRGILDIWLNYSYYDYHYRDQKTFLNKDNNPYFGNADDLSYGFVKGFGKKKYNQFLESIKYTHLFDNSNLHVSISRIDGDVVSLNPNVNASIFGGKGKRSNVYHQKTDFSLYYDASLFNKRLNASLGGNYKILQTSEKNYLIHDWRHFNSPTISFSDSSGGQSHLFGLFSDIQGVFLDSMLIVTFESRLDYWLGVNFYKQDMKIKNNNKAAFLPKFSVAYSPFSITTIKSSVGNSFKVPTMSQLLLDHGYVDGTSNIGNLDLKPEKAVNFDLGIEQSTFFDGMFKAYYFFSNFNDLIYHSSVIKKLQNAQKSIINGIELSYDQPLPYNMGIYANYTFTNAKIIKNPIDLTSEGKYLQNIPPHMGNVELYYDDDKFYGGLGAAFASKAFADSSNIDTVNNVYGSLDKYVLLNLKVGYNFDENLAMSMNINNVLNHKYYSYYKAPGMSFYLSLNTKL